jgi:hypothetical protein
MQQLVRIGFPYECPDGSVSRSSRTWTGRCAENPAVLRMGFPRDASAALWGRSTMAEGFPRLVKRLDRDFLEPNDSLPLTRPRAWASRRRAFVEYAHDN